jgi:hypothetical protein
MLILAGGPHTSLQTTPSITHALFLSTLPPFHRFLCALAINPALNWLYSSLRTARQSRLAYVIVIHYLYAVRVHGTPGVSVILLVTVGVGLPQAVLRIGAVCPWNRGSIPDLSKKCISYLNVAVRLWDANSLIQLGQGLKRPEREADYSLSSRSRLFRICANLLPYVLSWREQGHFLHACTRVVSALCTCRPVCRCTVLKLFVFLRH